MHTHFKYLLTKPLVAIETFLTTVLNAWDFWIFLKL